MTLPAFLHPDGPDGRHARLELHAVPGARGDGFAGLHGDRLKIRVAAPPEGGRANEAIRSLLAETLGVPVRDVTLLRGETARTKTFRVQLPPETVAERLGPPV